MYKLYLNNYTGKYLNCDFENGVAKTDNINVVNYFKRHNLKFEEEKTTKTQTAETKKKTTKKK